VAKILNVTKEYILEPLVNIALYKHMLYWAIEKNIESQANSFQKIYIKN